jgi:hypothetical protein
MIALAHRQMEGLDNVGRLRGFQQTRTAIALWTAWTLWTAPLLLRKGGVSSSVQGRRNIPRTVSRRMVPYAQNRGRKSRPGRPATEIFRSLNGLSTSDRSSIVVRADGRAVHQVPAHISIVLIRTYAASAFVRRWTALNSRVEKYVEGVFGKELFPEQAKRGREKGRLSGLLMRVFGGDFGTGAMLWRRQIEKRRYRSVTL